MDLSNAPLFANIPAHDLQRAMQWYEEKLGLRPVMDLGIAGQLYQTGGVSWLMYETAAAGTGKHTLAGWVVPSIDDAMGDLRAKGVVFEEYDMGDQGPTTHDGVARGPDGGAAAWFKDSEDNILSITELPPGMEMPRS
ncbi:MAG TPA: VOC family protein [Candidatus Limnocylindrales bacterium]|nr:VOC family protein [Candidatus Limnocylindrales bacterium]